jgi:hypothetical protein
MRKQRKSNCVVVRGMRLVTNPEDDVCTIDKVT